LLYEWEINFNYIGMMNTIYEIIKIYYGIYTSHKIITRPVWDNYNLWFKLILTHPFITSFTVPSPPMIKMIFSLTFSAILDACKGSVVSESTKELPSEERQLEIK